MMDAQCKWTHARLGEYLDRALSARDREVLRLHLDGCEGCAKALATTRELVGRLAEMDDVSLPAGFSQRVSARLHQEAEAIARESARRPAAPRGWSGLFRPLALPVKALAATTAGVAMLLAGFLMIDRQGPVPAARVAATAQPAAVAVPVSLGLGGHATVRIWFDSPQAVENVRFSLVLPPGLRMVSGGQVVESAALEWEGSLKQGRNLIPLQVRGVVSGDWTVTAAIEKGGARRERSIGLRVTGI